MKTTLAGRYIVSDPKICHEQPTFRGTRILVADVLEQVANGISWESIVVEWPWAAPPRPSIATTASRWMWTKSLAGCNHATKKSLRHWKLGKAGRPTVAIPRS